MPYEKARAALKVGASRPTLYRVEIPRAPNNASFDANEYLKFFCKSTSIPGVSVDTIGTNSQEMQGVVRQTASAVKYEKPFRMSVIERTDFHVYENLKRWFDSMCPDSNVTSNANQRMEYYSDYTCDIILTKLEYSLDGGDAGKILDKINRGKATHEGYNEILKVTFKNAYLVQIGTINLSSEAKNAATEYNVEFTYETYHTELKKDGA